MSKQLLILGTKYKYEEKTEKEISEGLKFTADGSCNYEHRTIRRRSRRSNRSMEQEG